MRIDRPLWATGVLLSAQQFQQQARWEAWSNAGLAQLTLVHPWGVKALAFDLDALRLGKLKATRLSVRMPDGTPIDTQLADPLPPAITLSALLTATCQRATVVLALPLEHGNGANCVLDGERVERPTRYRQVWREVQDHYGEEAVSVGVMEHQLSLRLDTDDNSDFLTCPLVRLQRDELGAWAIDAEYVPPLSSFSAHAGLLAQLDNVLTQLSTKRQRLMAMRRESNQRMADFAVADVSLFWLLNALNTYQPVLAELKAHPQRPPELVYLELAKLAGSLLTFSLEHDIDKIPAYRHDVPARSQSAVSGNRTDAGAQRRQPLAGKFSRRAPVRTGWCRLLPVGALPVNGRAGAGAVPSAVQGRHARRYRSSGKCGH
jgi:type VI secretion system protein ImpJ